MSGGRRAALVIAAYVLLAAIVIPVYPHFVSPNEMTRWLLAASVVDRGTVEVTSLVPILGPRFEDLSERDGHLYSNKAPGVAFLALPGYAMARAIFGEPSPGSLRAAVTAMRLCGATIPLLLLALVMTRLGQSFGIDERRLAGGAFILLFATPLFAYGLLLFSHALAAAATFAAWALLFGFRERRPSFAWAAGSLLGLAVVAEYPIAIAAIVLVIALAVTRDFGALFRTVAGGAPFAAGLALYDAIAFGNPLRLSTWYDRLPEYRQLGRSALFGVGVPSIETMLHLLFDPGRGLLVFSPVLVLAIPALIVAKKRLATRSWWTLVLVPLSIFLVYSGYPNWHGGWTAGPRYLVAAVPFLVFAMLFRDATWSEALLTGWSCCAVVLTSIVFPFVPNDFPLPWGSLAMPLLREGLIAPNLLHLIARPLAIAVPLLIVVAAAGMSAPPLRVAIAACGLVLAMAVGSQWSRLANPRIIGVQRAYLADVYFERAGELERFAAPQAVPPGLLRRRTLERQLPPTSWPF